ncbi:MAG: hypoxanthine phosphoribosyltransferase [Candidatus Zixiibacteriota bacterium]
MPSASEKKPAAQPFELLLDQYTIHKRVVELGAQITSDYAGKTVVLIGVLKSCVIFMADLIRQIGLPIELEFVSAASYRVGTSRETEISFSGGSQIPLKGKHVLLVDGVIDSARTVSTVMQWLQKEEPASLEIVTLLDKPASHRTRISIKYRGFAVGNEFVIGYGLDNTQKYRNLPFVGRMVEK